MSGNASAKKNGIGRREEIRKRLIESPEPVSGSRLAEELGVSRQVIVQDVAILRAARFPVISTPKGYFLETGSSQYQARVYRVAHSDEDMEKELDLFVDLGGYVEDVFIDHPLYGELRGRLDLSSRLDVKHFIRQKEMYEGTSLLSLTQGGVHYHTVRAGSEEILDIIEKELVKAGFLVK